MPAQMLGPIRPVVQRFKLGQFEVVTVLDGAMAREGVSPPFGLGQPAAALAALAAANRVPADRFENSYTVTLVNTGKSLVMFDAGLGTVRPGAGQLIDHLALAGYGPEDVDVIAFTHLHPDHIGGLRRDGARAFANARYVIGAREYEAWESGRSIPERRGESRDLFLDLMPPLRDATDLIEPGHEVVTGITAIEAYGHSAGHLAYHIESDGQRLLVWGDVTNHYAFSLQRPDWRVAFDDVPDEAIATRYRVLEMAAREELLVAGFHMPFPAIGYVVREGSFWRWEPASYQLRV